MIISKTPFRISFLGGGTDYPVWYRNNGGGKTISASIDKYCYISCRQLPPFFGFRHRIVWSKTEHVQHHDEIQHPAVREVLKFLEVPHGVSIHHDGDLPARAGLGSSSTFTVGLLHALQALLGRMMTKRQLALDAIHIEQERLQENVGSQDQVIAAYGGFNLIEFGGADHIAVHPVPMNRERLDQFQDHLMLFFTGISRTASEIAATQIANTHRKTAELSAMVQTVDEAIRILTGAGPLDEFGQLLHEGWQLKRSLTDQISTNEIDSIYETGRRAGALGGKILGAGGGGFILFFVPPERKPAVRQALQPLLHVPFRFENLGSQIIHYAPDLQPVT